MISGRGLLFRGHDVYGYFCKNARLRKLTLNNSKQPCPSSLRSVSQSLNRDQFLGHLTGWTKLDMGPFLLIQSNPIWMITTHHHPLTIFNP